jgi:DNA-binding transcriptional MerR regulator
LTSEDAGTDDKFDDASFPAYTVGRAAEMIGVSQAFLRSVEQAGLIEPERSDGGHRRYSRSQLRLVARVRVIADQGTPIEAACRIVDLEEQLEAARAVNVRATGTAETP